MPPVRLLALALLLLAVGLPARADDTALNDGRWGPEPIGGGLTGKESVIQMRAEHLDLRFGRKTSSVAARFVFRNTLPATPAKQLVGFPDLGAAVDEARRRSKPGHELMALYDGDIMGPIQGMQTLVDGVPTPSTLRYGFVRADATGYGWTVAGPADYGLMAWYALWLTFPPAKDVVVERRYRVATGTNVLGQLLLDYVVATGGAWHGPIGELVADVTLADGLTVLDLSWGAPLEQGRAPYPERRAWQQLSPTHLRLVWHDFEPRTDKRYGHIELTTLARIDSSGKPIKRRRR